VTQLAIKRSFKSPPHKICASTLPGKEGTHQIGVRMNKKRHKHT